MPRPAVPMVDVIRGPFAESAHSGHAVLCDDTGAIVQAWGDADAVILPRSSAKMIQALPLVASGAADAHRLGPQRLALSCASHEGAPVHVAAVNAWLADLGLGDDDLICGPQPSRDKALKLQMIRNYESPCRVHNNCSGKHAGFLTLTRHLKAGADYVDPAHPVQVAIKEAFESVTGAPSPGFGIDGCSAPNLATTMHGMARAMAFYASAHTRNDALSRAAAALTDAMIAHPLLVAGEGRACTRLMRAARERVAIKTGAEGYFVAILPDRRQGLALKITDGATRASDCAVAAILVQLGVLDAAHPDVKRSLNPDVHNFAGLTTGEIRPATTFP
ncbi:L-asparaginase [Salipiger aestuarii]|uniref:Asparaginase n=1 Tax=Salipiger aestuarii TaxID=568098 RepID=A0A327YLL6_9RHOB|nr:asparaginase [Salipiger aestuarii]EIE48920.1 L-asparaginase [Citreicella sp. 357]KAA8610329.1 L-asparaginase [Salipiger aestuarii]KAA8616345.1 L-asparaginase [Salipiger aestuarii]KAB2543560.1 L-asparaginase [Salipiger aestuarii]RAK21868.1 asparaginase [Salipiger aestuarii]